MDQIRQQIFMGNWPECGAVCYHLHQQLDRALSALSGLQQLYSGRADQEFGHERAQEMREEETVEIEKIAKEIYVALTGRKVMTTKEVK